MESTSRKSGRIMKLDTDMKESNTVGGGFQLNKSNTVREMSFRQGSTD